MSDPSFTLGIEEEYHLVDRETGELASEPPAELLSECERRLQGRVGPEFLRSQIEVGTGVWQTVGEAGAELAELRRVVVEVAAVHGLAPLAAATHPFSSWEQLRPTDKARYAQLSRDLEGVGRRLAICGLHVHVGLDDDDLRIDLMSQVAYFLPHLLALSTSSPFWRGSPTGLKSYRIAVFNELPRTGLPTLFESWGEYQRHVDVLVRCGVIDDPSRIWWDVRPSFRFPTLELRVTDVCTRLDDTLAIAALFQCLLRMLWRLKRVNQRWRRYATMLIAENRWRAQRYGTDAGLIDFGRGEIVPYAALLEEIIALVREDAEALGCLPQVEAARQILVRGTSAHRQMALHRQALAAGLPAAEALRAVARSLIAETAEGLTSVP